MSDTSAPRVPSAWELERTVSAWQQLRDMYASDPALADDEDVIAVALADAEITHPDVLLGRAIDALVWCERREVEADDIRREVVARRNRYQARAEAIRTLIGDLMDKLEVKSHRAKWGAASIAMGQPSLVLTDEQLVPDEYFKTERTLMRTPLIDDLKQGVVVPGAVMSNPAPVLRIRKL
jgi:Siphovirus Gp157